MTTQPYTLYNIHKYYHHKLFFVVILWRFKMGFFDRFRTNVNNSAKKSIITFSDMQWKAYAENGNVMCVPSHSEPFLIGKYNQSEHRKFEVYDSKGYLIGNISDNGSSALIYLSRIGALNRFKDLGFPKPIPSNLVCDCAESFPNIIMELRTNNELAYYKGPDYIGAAAAFVCMQSEMSEGKYHSFFKI